MTLRKIVLAACAALAFAAVLPFTAHAAGMISGVVKDDAGTVLSGVTIEITSDALDAKSVVVRTNAAGEYSVANLQGATYTLVFAKTDFQTFKREGLRLGQDAAATVSPILKASRIRD